VVKRQQDLTVLVLLHMYSVKQLVVKSADGLFLKNQLEHASQSVKHKLETYTSGVALVEHTT
jgi:hypothetical protein